MTEGPGLDSPSRLVPKGFFFFAVARLFEKDSFSNNLATAKKKKPFEGLIIVLVCDTRTVCLSMLL